MKKSYLVSPADAIKGDDGKWTIKYTIPSTGDVVTVTSDCAEFLAEQINTEIQYDLKRMDAVEPYRNAVKALVDLCLTQDGSGAKAAAQVLLSAYNRCFQVDLTDLCSLDTENFRYAVAVIEGRVICMREPQNMIENGGEIFHNLAKKFEHLHSKTRYSIWY